MAAHLHHSHGPDTGNGIRALRKALWVTLVFMVIELIGGLIANSLALMTDAVHMATDVGSLLLALFAAWISRKPAGGRMTFGYYRAEVLGALISGLALWGICGVIIYEAVRRFLVPTDVNGPLVVAISLVAIIMNFVTMRFLHGSHKENLNMRAAYLHVISDLMGNGGTLVAGVVIWTTGWMPIDPILSCGIAVGIIISAWRMISEAIEILMQASPRHIDLENIRSTLTNLDDVEALHDLHVWTLGTGRLALSVHIISKRTDAILTEAHEALKEQHHISYTTIQVEHPDRFNPNECWD